MFIYLYYPPAPLLLQNPNVQVVGVHAPSVQRQVDTKFEVVSVEDVSAADDDDSWTFVAISWSERSNLG